MLFSQLSDIVKVCTNINKALSQEEANLALSNLPKLCLTLANLTLLTHTFVSVNKEPQSSPPRRTFESPSLGDEKTAMKNTTKNNIVDRIKKKTL